MKRSHLKSLLHSPLVALLLCVLALGRLCGAQTPPAVTPAATPMPTAFWHKVETAPQTMMRRIVDLEASSDLKVRDVLQVPRKREIEADATLARRVEIIDGEHVSIPFWVGRCGFDAVGHVVQPDGTRRDLYDPQKYLWSADPSIIVPLKPASPPGSMIVRLDVGAFSHFSEQDLPPALRELFTLALWEGFSPPAADGRPLDQLKLGPSTPNKYLYWNLGELEDAQFPQTSTVVVGVTGAEADTPVHPAQVKVHWQMPPLRCYEFEMSLWDWVDEAEAPSATFEEFWDKLTTNQEFQKELVTEVGIEAASVVIEKAIGGNGVRKIVGKIITARPQIPPDFARRFTSAAQRTVLRRLVPVAGQPIARWPWRTKIRTNVEDLASPQRFRSYVRPEIEQEFRAEGLDPTAEAVQEELERRIKQREQEKRKGKAQQYVEPPYFFLYTVRPQNIAADYWDAPNGRADEWPIGHYLTDIRPWDCAMLRRGQLSFAMFGHPHWFGSNATVTWLKIGVGAIEDADGNEIAPPLTIRSENAKDLRVAPDTPLFVPWRQIYVIAGDADNGRNFDPRRIVDQGTVSFLPNISDSPGGADVPLGALFPAAGNGTWYDQAGNEVTNPPVWRGELDWLPPANSVTESITNGRKIRFRRGYPDFWSFREPRIPDVVDGISIVLPEENGAQVQHGTQQNGLYDFKEADIQLAQWLEIHATSSSHYPFLDPTTGRAIVGHVEDWRADYTVEVDDPANPGQKRSVPRPLTWHHLQDMKTMQLVPGRGLNNPGQDGITHDGGGTWARVARW